VAILVTKFNNKVGEIDAYILLTYTWYAGNKIISRRNIAAVHPFFLLPGCNLEPFFRYECSSAYSQNNELKVTAAVLLLDFDSGQ